MVEYMAVVSLMSGLEQLLRSSDGIYDLGQRGCPFTKQTIELLYTTVSSMESLLLDTWGQSYDHGPMDQTLENRIIDVAQKAGCYLGISVVLGSVFELVRVVFVKTKSSTTEVTKVIEEMVSINKELKKICDGKMARGFEDTDAPTGESSSLLDPARISPHAEEKLVGLENDMVEMLDRLTGLSSQLKVLSVTGMAGIGKTTFARNLYDHPLILHRFHVLGWSTVSQKYQGKQVLLGLLGSLSNLSDEMYGRSDEELKERVYKSLKGRRYFIVLDDVWDTKAWDDLGRIFPDDNNGSRILLTSRIRDVAVHASHNIPPHCLHYLGTDESWELLCSKVFPNGSCPVELVAIGKKIAHKCRGLPLAIVVVGGLLSKMQTKLDVWYEVEQSVRSLVMNETENCQKILALSYNHLPYHLKACFLYLAVFPEDYDISAKQLLWLWIAEGFIRPRKLKNYEEVAEEYLEELITRSLVFVKRKCSDGRIKTCYIHDLMRDLCLRESHKHNFIHVINSCGPLPVRTLHDLPGPELTITRDLCRMRRLSFHSCIRQFLGRVSLPYTHTITCFETLSISNHDWYFGMGTKLLKVLNILNMQFRTLPQDIQRLTHLKFLALTVQESFRLNEYSSLFLSLQTVIINAEVDVLFTINFVDMPELRHFHLKRGCLTDSSLVVLGPPLSLMRDLLEERHGVQINLQSLSTICSRICSKELLLSVPNLTKLGIRETEEDHRFRGWFKNLVNLQELKCLKYSFSNPFVSSGLKPYRLPSWENFPPKLTKLTLSGTSFPWEDMVILSMLPKLEVLKLKNYAFSGPVWKCEEGSFSYLKFLQIGSTDLEIWEAERTHFPKLQHLVLRHCRYLKEIPPGIGEAPLLETIRLSCCKESAVTSARELQEEQESLGNDGLTVYVTGV